jgi:hypothetical protein
MKPLRGARHGARPLTAPSTAPPRKLRLASQRSAENSIGTSEESSIGIDKRSRRRDWNLAIANRGGPPLRHQPWLSLYRAASAGRIARVPFAAGGEVRAP